MKHIWCCDCGYKEECDREETVPGAVYQCKQCKVVWGRVTPKHGGRAWIKISDSDVKFHGLLKEPENED